MGDVIARITNIGAKCSGEQQVLGRFFRVNKFTVGVGTVGCDPATHLPLVPDVAESIWPAQTSGQLEDMSPAYAPSIQGPRSVVYTVVVPEQYRNRQISSIGLYGTYVYTDNVADQGLVGSTFLYAIANFGLITVPSNQLMLVTLRVNIY